MKLQTTQKDGKLYGKLPDTGWVDLNPYLNSNDFTVRSGFPIGIRKIGNRVYLKGIVYNPQNLSTANNSILTNIPAKFRPTIQYTIGGCSGNLAKFNMWINTGGALRYAPESLQGVDQYGGIDLSMLSWFTD